MFRIQILTILIGACILCAGCASQEAAKKPTAPTPTGQKAQGMSPNANAAPPLVNGSMLGPHPKPGSKEAREAAAKLRAQSSQPR